MTTDAAPLEQPLDTLAAFLKAAGDALRLEVLQVLGQNSFGVLELCEIMAMKQSGMSHHLKVLAQAGLVEKRREGNSIFYRRRLPPPRVPTERLHGALFEELDEAALDTGTAERLAGVQAQRAAQSRAFFARHADDLSRQQELIADYEQYAEQACELLDRALAATPARQALEIGPGDGRFLAPLAARFEQVLGLDNSDAMLALARRRVRQAKLDNVTLVAGEWPQDGERLPRVDAVVLNMVLHHLPSPASALKAAAAQLNEGGVLVVTDLCRHDQRWAVDACGDFWLGFDEADLVTWAGRSGLVLRESLFLAMRNGFQVQVRSFEKIG
ncbi:ArsR/SmtB family transcription factor [Alloalcanivorax gelatiniphagus]|uniref:Metalloregulator ArsR/SmtB family transcription factor n=3 Tax=Alloalcanivorax gelatiniphagus TaxID=1194167 RepID=A0ABY2XIX3_9GAMM|nr:metalloregulator ArsR/SmtB family transcription factor [Alloalcanivorax gelatiniphagus]TMW10996.1 metalloregulator ArsR/SmtB family transcription factor [Alloalcanivorax gelatiniphagus]|tara:strand:+ start:157 stop:1140 length:984 start_codon:yes stop_codon:yes gene_type:complete